MQTTIVNERELSAALFEKYEYTFDSVVKIITTVLLEGEIELPEINIFIEKLSE
jgi:hypothetical protein